MKIRTLTVEELPLLLPYGQDFLNGAGKASGEFCPDRFVWFWTNLIQHARAVIFAAFEGDEFLGALSAFPIPDPYRMGTVVQEGFWYVRPEYRHTRAGLKLFKAFEEWAVEEGDEIRIGCMYGEHYISLSNFFISRGYEPFEKHFLKGTKRGSH